MAEDQKRTESLESDDDQAGGGGDDGSDGFDPTADGAGPPVGEEQAAKNREDDPVS